MTYSLTWLKQVLTDAGLKVQETPQWEYHGHGDMSSVRGVLCHHTSGPRTGNMNDLHVLIEGRPDLPGPLSQLGLGRDGTWFLVAAGKGWHAGRGAWQGVTDGNGHLIGIEAENTGEKDDPWPDVQMDSYRRGVAAILKHIGAKPIMCAGHKEYALPKGRKDDPSFDMDAFRAEVEKLMAVPAPAKKTLVHEDIETEVHNLENRETVLEGREAMLESSHQLEDAEIQRLLSENQSQK
jgi:hypothetical protein